MANPNIKIAAFFTARLKKTAHNDKTSSFSDLLAKVSADPEFVEYTLNVLEAAKAADALRASKKKEVPLDENGNPIKRKRGRPRKNPLPVAPVVSETVSTDDEPSPGLGSPVQTANPL